MMRPPIDLDNVTSFVKNIELPTVSPFNYYYEDHRLFAPEKDGFVVWSSGSRHCEGLYACRFDGGYF